MNSIQTPSPNHDERTLPISLLVLHYTGMETGQAALTRMCDASAKVSAHYMVDTDGTIYQLVDEARRAWHAGVSAWAGETNINSNSIGIEIVNGGHDYGLPDFPMIQIEAIIDLSRAIMSRHTIPPLSVVAHSDIAPERKQDPGERFPWALLAQNSVGVWPATGIPEDNYTLFKVGMRDRGVSVVQSGLAYLGYNIEITGILDAKTISVLRSFQRRYRPENMDGQVDIHTMEILSHLTNYKRSRP